MMLNEVMAQKDVLPSIWQGPFYRRGVAADGSGLHKHLSCKPG